MNRTMVRRLLGAALAAGPLLGVVLADAKPAAKSAKSKAVKGRSAKAKAEPADAET